MNEEKKNVLFISYYFPPSGGSGVLRIVRFIKNMQHFGCSPFVITIDEEDVRHLGYGSTYTDDSYLDVERLTNVKRVRLIRPSNIPVRFLGYIKKALLPFIARSKRRLRQADAPRDDSDGIRNNGGARNVRSYHSSSMNPFLKFIYELILITDQAFEWAPRAVWHGIRFVGRNNISVVCSSSPPWSVHIVGCMLKLFCRTHWIVDLRDPVFGIETSEIRTKSSAWLIRMFYRVFESILMRMADVVVCNCEEIRDYYSAKYPKTRFEVIINSYDPDDYEELEAPIGPREARNICHFGELYPTIRTPDAFLESFATVIKSRSSSPEPARAHFYGAINYTNSQSFQALINDLGIAPMIESHDYLPHDVVLRKMVSSVALLLLQPHYSTNYQIPAKLFEYVAVRRPLLAIAPEGSATSRLIKKYNLGIVCDPGDKAAIDSAVASALNEELPLPDKGAIEQFSARHMTAKLVSIINELH